jgi:crotonobetainyl-CoA:carnitine CoA-transferase CaiB-like acyl-CoA transferase
VTPLLRGLRILEVSAIVIGPYAGQILADLGAEVVKLEPIAGDVARLAPPHGGGMSALFANNNRNKKALAVDLKCDRGKEVLRRLILRSDVLLHNMRPEAAERLGVDAGAAHALNPRLVHCSAAGFGERGRYRGRPALDDIIQAASGLASLGRRNGEDPRFIPTILADKIGALHAVYGILAALLARSQGHPGPFRVEVPMFEAMVAFILNEHLAEATFNDSGQVGYSRVLSENRRPYRTRDGWLAVMPYTVDQWRRFLLQIGRNEIVESPWFSDASERNSRIDFLYSVIAAELPRRDTESWLTELTGLDIPCSRVNSLEDLLTDPHLADVGFFDVGPNYPKHIRRMLPQPVVFDDLRPEADVPPPALGADTREVLASCDFAESEIEEMINAGIASARRES